MAVMTIDNVISPAELELLLASARSSPSALARAKELQRQVSGALLSALGLSAAVVYVWDTALLVST